MATQPSAARVVLITGASSGFGRAVANALHARGDRVFGTTRAVDPPSDPDTPAFLTMDVTDGDSVARGVAEVLGDAGRIDVLVNNAGFGYAGAIEDTSVEEARAQLETNFFGLHRLCLAVLPHMRARGGGRIVNVGSLGGRVSVPFQGLYCASKFAVAAYTEALRLETRPFGIHVSMIEPGDFATAFTANRRLVGTSHGESAYSARCASAVKRMAEDESANADLGPVVRAALRAIDAGRPRLRYPVASITQRMLVALRPLMPQALFERLIADHYGIR